MANYNITASGSSQQTPALASDKVRIATTVAVYYEVGSNPTATTSSIIIGANQIERDIYVGRGNRVAILAVATGGACSITELGAIPNRTTNNDYYDGPLINPSA